ncbi:SDR family NAD(P)-dependent oxidoreductase [Streptomyces mesophilus]|uniref:SDR family NAD(P)-dependent oxidoreductase n=1 Tax=Streptomyces mesophilus TaxID=1775132 RepID=UPI003330FD2B
MSAPRTWNVRRLPSAAGRTFLVTGANAGIGYFVAEQLAAAGATVLLAARSAARAETAMASIRSRTPDARPRHVLLDLSDPASVKAVADRLDADRLDALIHNAGIALDEPTRHLDAYGRELMFATNHLGHFALTQWLAPLLAAAPAGRVVTVGSFAARSERLDLDDLQSVQDYDAKRSYGRSKLAQMSFGFELDRRLRALDSGVLSVVAHPGGALDSLTPPRAGLHKVGRGARVVALPARAVLQGKEAGAWPIVRAALDPEVRGGELWGPRGFGLRGLPRREPVPAHMADPETATRLWAASCELTGTDPHLGFC